MGDPTGYLDEGKGLPWITMDYHVLHIVEGATKHSRWRWCWWAACISCLVLKFTMVPGLSQLVSVPFIPNFGTQNCVEPQTSEALTPGWTHNWLEAQVCGYLTDALHTHYDAGAFTYVFANILRFMTGLFVQK